MRWVNLVSGVLAALMWGYILYLGMALVDMIACANLPDFSIFGTLVVNVIVPTVMITLTVAAVVVTNWVRQPGRVITWLPIAALVSVPVYYAFATGLSITASALGNCPF